MPPRRSTPAHRSRAHGVRERDSTHDLERPPDKTLAFWSEMPLLYDATAARPRPHRLPRVPDAPRHRCVVRGDLPEVRHEAGSADPEAQTPMPYRVSDARRDHRLMGRAVPAVRDDAPVARRRAGADHEHASAPHTHDRSTRRSSGKTTWSRSTAKPNTTNMIWQLIDRDTGAKNADISWTFTVGDRVKIRLVNEMGSDHPMPHPFHVHGAGRFIVLSEDGITEPNLVWKDTVLLLAGQTVDILLDVTNPGLWMAHCHIAEHNQSRHDVQLRSRAGVTPRR